MVCARWQVKLCDPYVTQAISEHFRGKGLIYKALYKFICFLADREPHVVDTWLLAKLEGSLQSLHDAENCGHCWLLATY